MKRRSTPPYARKAERVGAALPVSRLHPAVGRVAESGRPRGPWCVALSGGADSVALLLLLWQHWPAWRDRLVALHFNHRLRGRAAEADARFCRKLGAALGVKCVVGVWRGRRTNASEAESRAARHRFFGREMQRRGARLLWLAHQQDDIAESMLMRLARGSGSAGLAAPRPAQATSDGRLHLRPMLSLAKADIMAALKKAGAVWREDGSNAGQDFFRNRIRRAVVPAWQKAAKRDARGGAALSRELLEEDDTALEGWLDRLAPLRRAVLDLRVLAGVPRAVVRRALHRWMLAVQPETDLSRRGFGLLLGAVERGTPTRFSLGRSGFAVIRNGKLAFSKG